MSKQNITTEPARNVPPTAEDVKLLVQGDWLTLDEGLEGVEVCPECHGAGCDMCSNGFIPTFPQANAKASAPQVGGEPVSVARQILARWLLDNRMSDDEAFEAVACHPSISPALSQEAEPVAWRWKVLGQWNYTALKSRVEMERSLGENPEPLYTHPSDRGGEVKG